MLYKFYMTYYMPSVFSSFRPRITLIVEISNGTRCLFAFVVCPRITLVVWRSTWPLKSMANCAYFNSLQHGDTTKNVPKKGRLKIDVVDERPDETSAAIRRRTIPGQKWILFTVICAHSVFENKFLLTTIFDSWHAKVAKKISDDRNK